LHHYVKIITALVDQSLKINYQEFNMNKTNSIFFTAILALVSGSALASGTNTCDYPQHFKVVGGKITALEAVQSPNSALSVKLTSEVSFDVYDNSNCKVELPRAIRIKVEADRIHTNEMIFADSPDGKITRIRNNSLNNYDLDAVNKSSTTDYEFAYKVKNIPQASFAISAPPSACPAIDTIKKVKFTSVHQMYDGAWQATTNNHFGMTDEWTLSSGIFRFFDNGNDVLIKANALLTTLTTFSGPDQLTENEWVCWYKTQLPTEPTIFAISPSVPR
jgi:hypothetical protein